MTYLNAWLLTSYGYWYPDAVINVYRGNKLFTFTYQDSSYFQFETEPPGTRESKFPVLEEFYRKLSLELYQQKIPVVSMLFSPGFLFWVYAFLMFYLLWQERNGNKGGTERFLPLLLVGVLWLTAVIGPNLFGEVCVNLMVCTSCFCCRS